MSPGVPPRGAGWPWPRTRIFLPSSMPAGIFTSRVSDLPAGRSTVIWTSPPVMAVAKGICSSWARSPPRCGRGAGGFAEFAGGAAKLAKEVAHPAGRLLPKTLAEELAQVDVLGAEARWPGPARSRRPGPTSGPPAVGRRCLGSRRNCHNGRTSPAFQGCSARRTRPAPFGTSSWPSYRRGSCRGGTSEPIRGRPSGFRPARLFSAPPECCNSLPPSNLPSSFLRRFPHIPPRRRRTLL